MTAPADEITADELPAAVVSRHRSEDDEPVHLLFGLSYANYLVLHRTLLQSMPVEWQRRFVRCVEELDAAWHGSPDYVETGGFMVKMRAPNGKQFAEDPVPHYNRGRARVRMAPVVEDDATGG